MPDFTTEVDIDPQEFLSECDRTEKNELIDLIVEECTEDSQLKAKLIRSVNEYFPTGLFLSQSSGTGVSQNTFMQDEFLASLHKLGEAYFRLSNEDIEKINELAKRF